MSLQFIIGGSGTGKSRHAFETIIREAGRHPDVLYYIIVPEQFTMQAQRTAALLSPGRGILNIDVLSFQRLAYRVFEEVGGDTRILLSDTGKSMVLRRLSQEKQKELPYLGSLMSKPGCLDEVKSLISEFMQYDIGPDEAARMQDAAPEGSLLKKKLSDVCVLYRAFREYLGNRYTTGEEIPDLLLKVLPLSERLKGSVVLLDGYTGFTPVQINVVRELAAMCSKVMVTVTMDPEENRKAHSFGLFSMSRKMITSLRSLTDQFDRPVILSHTEKTRFGKAPALRFLEENLFRYNRAQYRGDPREIQVWYADNPREEVEDTARRINRAVREQGLSYGEIAVVTGNLEEYAPLAREIFLRRDIPCFIDETHSVMMNPFVEFIRASLEMIGQGFTYESVFRYLRCSLSDVTQEETDLLENYVLALGIRGFEAYRETWVHVYRGMDPADILRINEIREKFVNETEEFRVDMSGSGKTVLDYCRALYRFIARSRIQEKLLLYSGQFREAEERSLEKEYGQVYGIVMELLDQMTDILGKSPISRRDFVQILETGFSKAKIALIPQGQDQVLVGDMERTRLYGIRALFFVGVNEGSIPKNTQAGGILTESDREFFAREGIELAPDPREQMNIQRFYLYLSLTKPDTCLQLSCSAATGKGEAASPAYLIGTIQSLFPDLTIRSCRTQDTLEMLEQPSAALYEFLRLLSEKAWKKEDPVFSELFSWYLTEPGYEKEAGRLIEASLAGRGSHRLTEEAARALYGEISASSATRLERFAACSFAHYLRYGLRLEERTRYEFRPADMGSLLHAALERFSKEIMLRGLSWTSLTDEERDSLAVRCITDTARDYGNRILKSSARNAYMLKRAGRILKRSCWALQQQLKEGNFEPEGFEVAYEGGRIDRVDILKESGKVLVKVIDYKTGSTVFDLTSVYYGLQLQLMLYLDAALKAEEKANPGTEAVPAGVFYFQVKDPQIDGDPDDGEEETEAAILKEYKMSGLVQADPDVVRRMDRSQSSFPTVLNKDGTTFRKGSSAATQEQMQAAGRHVKHLTEDFCRQILEGDAEILPYRLGDKTPCDYCAYRESCGFDRKIPGYVYKELKKLDKDEIWERILARDADDMRNTGQAREKEDVQDPEDVHGNGQVNDREVTGSWR